MPEEVHHHHYHHRRGGGCLLDIVIVFIVLAVIGGISQQTDGNSVEAILGVALVGYFVYRVFFKQGNDEEDGETPA